VALIIECCNATFEYNKIHRKKAQELVQESNEVYRYGDPAKGDKEKCVLIEGETGDTIDKAVRRCGRGLHEDPEWEGPYEGLGDFKKKHEDRLLSRGAQAVSLRRKIYQPACV